MKNKRLVMRPVWIGICLTLVLVAPLFIAACPKQAPTTPEPIKLLLATFLPESEINWQGAKQWAEELEEKTDGRVIVEYSVGGALGKPAEYYDLLLNGICDVAVIFTSFTPGLFVMSEVSELGFVYPSSEIATKAGWEICKKGYLDKEFADVKPINVYFQKISLFFRDKPVTSVADIRGLKLSTIGGRSEEMAKAMGAIPVFISTPEIYGALEKGTVDGKTTGWLAISAWKWYEVLKYATEPGTAAMCATWLMNKETYNRLPKDVQVVIDEIYDSGKYQLMMGKAIDEADAEAKSVFLQNGGQIVNWTPAAFDEIGELSAPVWAKWIADAEAKGLPARNALDDFWFALKELGVDRPAVGYTPEVR